MPESVSSHALDTKTASITVVELMHYAPFVIHMGNAWCNHDAVTPFKHAIQRLVSWLWLLGLARCSGQAAQLALQRFNASQA
mgnify:CR=1 FL=1